MDVNFKSIHGYILVFLGKHAYVDEFVEGKTVTDTGLSSSMGYLK